MSINILRYKGFIGSIEISLDDKCLYGKLLYVNDLVTYEAKIISELEKEFKKAVDDYLETCEKLGREPSKPFKGTLNVRIGGDLHKETAFYAALHGVSLNKYIADAVKKQVAVEKSV